ASPKAMSRLLICKCITPGAVALPKSELPDNDPREMFNMGTLGKRTAPLTLKEIEPLTDGVSPYCKARLLTSTVALWNERTSPAPAAASGLVHSRLQSEKPPCWICRFGTVVTPRPWRTGELSVTLGIVASTC